MDIGLWIKTRIFKLIRFFTGFLPLKNTIVFESGPDFSDNTMMVCEEMHRQGLDKKYAFIWLANKKEPNRKVPDYITVLERNGSVRERLAAYYATGRSKYILDSNNYVHKMQKRQIRVHLKHGIPLKSGTDYNFSLGEVDMMTVPTPYWLPIVSEEYGGIDEKKLKPLGFPRDDVLIPKAHPRKTVIWMPTYRTHSDTAAINAHRDVFEALMPYGLPYMQQQAQFEEINALFKANNATLLIRLHPAQDVSKIRLEALSNIRLCDDRYLTERGQKLYELLCETDALITDYSSVYYDYLLLDQPIALATADYEEFSKYHGLITNSREEFQRTFPAEFVDSYEELLAFFGRIFRGEDAAEAERTAARVKYMGEQTGDSAKRIVAYMKENLGL